MKRIVLVFALVLWAASAWAASPTVQTTATTSVSTATSTPLINLPASIQAGDLLLVFLRHTNAGTVTWPGTPDVDWHELFEDSSDASNDVTAMAWREADGTEGATITVTLGAANRVAALAWRISGAIDPDTQPPEFATLTTGTSLTPDPGTSTPTGGSQDYLFLAITGMEGENTAAPTFPASYVGGIDVDTGTGGTVPTNCVAAGASRQLTAASDDPGTFTYAGTSDDWTATTVAVHPAGAPPATTNPGWSRWW